MRSPLAHHGLGLMRRWIVIHAMFATWYLLVALVVHSSVLRTEWMPFRIRMALVVEEWAWLLIPTLVVAIPAARRNRWLLGVPFALVLAGSWGAFQATGRFASLDTLRFFLVVPKQSIEHAHDLYQGVWRDYGVMLLLGAVVLGIGEAARRVAVSLRRRMVLLLAATGLVVLVWELRISMALTASTVAVDDLTTGVSYSTATLWRDLRRHTSGPATTLARSITADLAPDTAVYHPSPFVTVHAEPRTGAAGDAVPGHRWNVLLIVVESMRRDILFGDATRPVMPVTQEIAGQSLRFTDAYTTATQTNLAAPVPLSGQYPLRWKTMGPYPQVINWPRVMLHDVLRPAGWRTAIFSSQNEDWWGMKRMLATAALDTLFDAESYHGSTYLPKGDVGFTRFARRAKKSGKIDDHDTASEAIDWLARERDRPFMLALNFQDSHLPYGTPDEAPRRFGTGRPGFPILFGRYPEDSVETVRNEYRNALAYVDDQIGRIRAALAADGRWDSTLVVITGDHGQAFFEHQLAAHANGLWQEQVRIPLVMRIPGRTPLADGRPASHVDIASTIVDALGLPAQPAWQGHSLIAAEASSVRPRFFMVQTPLAHEIGVVAGEWKLVIDLERGLSRLTDLSRDPGERRDLSSEEVAVTAMLSGVLRTWAHEQLAYYGSIPRQRSEFPPRFSIDSLRLPVPLRPR